MRGHIILRDGHIGTISTVEALGKGTTESVGNISRGVGFYGVVNDGVRNRRLTVTGFAVGPKNACWAIHYREGWRRNFVGRT